MRRELMLDWLHEGMNLNQANNNLLKDIQHRLSLEDKTPEMYRFKSPPKLDSELEREKILYDPHSEAKKFDYLETQYVNNIDQQRIFDTIMSAVNLGEKKYFFIDGPGGTGKTTVIKKIITKLRAEGKIVQVCASTTLAATLYENAMTAHSLFKFPVEDDDQKDSEERTCCKLENTERLELLQNTQVIIWDEFVSNNKDLFEAVQRELHMCRRF
jgi:Cdc6-like AAA superfamily ATPase